MVVLWMLALVAGGPGCKSKPSPLPPPPPLENPGPVVAFLGEVRNQIVPWREGLSLAEALAEADYVGARVPLSILIFRQGKTIRVNPRRLLTGTQNPILRPGDYVQVQR